VLVIFGGANHYITPFLVPGEERAREGGANLELLRRPRAGNCAVRRRKGPEPGVRHRLTIRRRRPGPTGGRSRMRRRNYIDVTLSAIVTFEIQVTRLIGKFKASQHRAAAERQSVLAGLESQGYGADDRREVIREPKS